MFLDDKLFNIGKSRGKDPHWSAKNSVHRYMIRACMDYLPGEKEAGVMDPDEFIAIFKRMFYHWENACRKLHKFGITWVDTGGLKDYFEADDVLRELLQYIYGTGKNGQERISAASGDRGVRPGRIREVEELSGKNADHGAGKKGKRRPRVKRNPGAKLAGRRKGRR